VKEEILYFSEDIELLDLLRSKKDVISSSLIRSEFSKLKTLIALKDFF
jgi:hypothetical protein